MKTNFWKLNRWTVFGIGLVCFAAGSLATVRLAQLQQVKADSNRVFELRVYHAVPGKLRRWSHGLATRLQGYSPNTI
jgi:hypothetical protein